MILNGRVGKKFFKFPLYFDLNAKGPHWRNTINVGEQLATLFYIGNSVA